MRAVIVRVAKCTGLPMGAVMLVGRPVILSSPRIISWLPPEGGAGGGASAVATGRERGRQGGRRGTRGAHRCGTGHGRRRIGNGEVLVA